MTESRTTPRPRNAALTGLEAMVSLSVITLVLGFFVMVSQSLVSTSKEQQTAQTLRQLSRSLTKYYRNHGNWPSAVTPTPPNTPMARCMLALRGGPYTFDELATDLPGLTQTSDTRHFTVFDGYGHELTYVNPSEAASWAEAQRRFKPTRSDRPFFVSGGPDGQIGDLSAEPTDPKFIAATDDIYSFDLEAFE